MSTASPAPTIALPLLRWPGPAALLPWLTPLALAALWLLALHYVWISPQTLPTPGEVGIAALDLAHGGELVDHVLHSLRRLLLGLVPGVLAGIALGSVLGLSRRGERLLYPSFAVWVQVPNLALVPLLMAFLGIGDLLKVVIIFNAVLVPMAIHTQAGMRDVPGPLREAARVLRLSPWLTMTRLYLPAAVPAMLTGLRLALASAWTSMVVVELLASSEGIGYLMVWGRQMFQLDIVFVCIAVIGLLGLAMEHAAQTLDRRLVRWPRPALQGHRHHATARGDLLPWLLPAAACLLWYLASSRGWVADHALPPPEGVLRALWQGVADGTLTAAMGQSLGRYLHGLAWGASAGLVLGLASGLWPTLQRLLGGTLGTLRQIAIFAWLPLLTAWAGTGEGARVLFIAIASFFPVHIATQRGVANLPANLVETAAVLRLGFLRRLRYLVLPGAASAIFAGLRLALIYGWLATIGAEYFMASSIGIGSLMINAQQLMNTETILAGVVLVSLTGAFLNLAGRALEGRATRWRTA